MSAVRIPAILHICLVVLIIVQSIRSQSLDVISNEVSSNIGDINRVMRRRTDDSSAVQIFHKSKKSSLEKPVITNRILRLRHDRAAAPRWQQVHQQTSNGNKSSTGGGSGSSFFDFQSSQVGDISSKGHQGYRHQRRPYINDQQLLTGNGNADQKEPHEDAMTRAPMYNHVREDSVLFPVTFRSSAAHLVARFKLYATFSIAFQMKTTQQADGLILYSGGGVVGSGRDFMAVELINGHIRYAFDLGSGTRSLRDTLRYPVNDNRWHDVAIVRQELNRQMLEVDGVSVVDDLPAEKRAMHFDTGDELYVGGVPVHAYNTLPKQVRSRDGFRGCLASLELDREEINLFDNPFGIPEIYRRMIVSGCDDEEGVHDCTGNACHNGGICESQSNGNTCNCDMTSFTGPTCNDDSIAYTFGRRGGVTGGVTPGRVTPGGVTPGGVITFALPEQDWPDTKRDQISLGLITNQSEDAVLLRISSGSSSDKIEMELVDGKVYVVYNVGKMDHPIGEMFESVNDSRYHTVRFTREGPNSTIQVDNQHAQFKYPEEEFYDKLTKDDESEMITFNHLAKVSIGGKKDSTGKLVKPFHGTLAGLTMNGFRILDLASEGDDRVTIDGDVELEVKPLRKTTQETSSMTSTTHNIFTDRKNYKSTPMGGHGSFIISATDAGVGCSNTKNCHQSTSDAFIKPVVTRRRSGPVFWQSTTKPFTKATPFDKFRTYSSERPITFAKPTIRDEKNTKKIVDQSGSQPCEGDRNDDEDCVSSGLDGIDKNSDVPEVSTKPPRPPNSAEVREIPPTTSAFQEILFTSYLSNVDGLFQSYTTSPVTPFLVEVATSSDEEEEDLDSQGMLSRVLTDSMADRGFAPPTGSLAMNIGLIGGIAAGVIVLLFVLVYAVYKYRAKEEEIRKLDRLPTHQSADFEFPVAGGGGASGPRCHFSPSDSCDVTTNMIPVSTETANNGNGNAKRSKKRDVKEWYV